MVDVKHIIKYNSLKFCLEFAEHYVTAISYSFIHSAECGWVPDDQGIHIKREMNLGKDAEGRCLFTPAFTDSNNKMIHWP